LPFVISHSSFTERTILPVSIGLGSSSGSWTNYVGGNNCHPVVIFFNSHFLVDHGLVISFAIRIPYLCSATSTDVAIISSSLVSWLPSKVISFFCDGIGIGIALQG
jgi:hypothetical protein